jgi:flavin reductase (DIM6/NTAB) family NADH-FMN oxidoreductase RutF
VTPQAGTPSVEPDEFRNALRLRPEGVTIVTASDEFGHLLGLTASSCTSVSLDPPLLLVCILNRSPLLGPLRAGAHFTVHLLSARQERLAKHFATRMIDKFDTVGLKFRITGSGCPRLEGALAAIECSPHDLFPGGDHTIVVGRVVDICLDEECDAGLLTFGGRLQALRVSRKQAATVAGEGRGSHASHRRKTG